MLISFICLLFEAGHLARQRDKKPQTPKLRKSSPQEATHTSEGLFCKSKEGVKIARPGLTCGEVRLLLGRSGELLEKFFFWVVSGGGGLWIAPRICMTRVEMAGELLSQKSA